MRRPSPSRGGWAHFRLPATHCARVVLAVPPKKSRGRRKRRVRGAPVVPREVLVARGVVTTGSPQHSASPARWCYGLLRALPGDRAFLPPSPSKRLLRELDASVGASGPHDFAVRACVVRLSTRARPPHPVPTFVTMANAPRTGRDAGHTQMICQGRKAENFHVRGWTAM